MDKGFLIKNDSGVIGLVVLDDPRPLTGVTFLSGENKVRLSYKDDEPVLLPTDIARDIRRGLLHTDKILIAHFAADGLDGEPDEEYFVPVVVAD